MNEGDDHYHGGQCMLTCALLVGYIGSAYHGNQLQTHDDIATVERELFAAVNALTSADVTSSRTFEWKRTARTDTGVHALCNVITFHVTSKQVKVLTADALNALLPRDIRIHGARICRRRQFDAKRNAQSRTYRYVLPAWVLHTHTADTYVTPTSPSEQQSASVSSEFPLSDAELCAAYLSDLQRQVADRLSATQSTTQRVNRRKYNRIGALQAALATNNITALQTFANEYRRQSVVSSAINQFANIASLSRQQTYQQTLRNLTLSTVHNYRISAQELFRLQSFMTEYIGEYNYNNFTTKRLYQETPNVSMIRHVTAFEIENILLINDTEYIVIAITAHSFMLNQIRKMIGALIAVMRNALPDDTIRKLLNKNEKLSTAVMDVNSQETTTTTIVIPSAPACGLYLLKPTFMAHHDDEINDDQVDDDSDNDNDDNDTSSDDVIADMNDWINQVITSAPVIAWRQRVMNEICSKNYAFETFQHWCIAVHALQRENIYRANKNENNI